MWPIPKNCLNHQLKNKRPFIPFLNGRRESWKRWEGEECRKNCYVLIKNKRERKEKQSKPTSFCNVLDTYFWINLNFYKLCLMAFKWSMLSIILIIWMHGYVYKKEILSMFPIICIVLISIFYVPTILLHLFFLN